MTALPSYKMIILGDTGVGKTSLAMRQCRGQFSFQMMPTVGTSHMKTIVNVGGSDIELKIWDTAGQEQFASLVSMYARNSQICLIVASFVDPTSIDNIKIWHDRLLDAGENPPIVVAINKQDMEVGAPMTNDQIRDAIGEKYANVFFVSAKTGDGVESLFVSAATEAHKSMIEQNNKNGVLISEKAQSNRSNSGCC
ncbi:small GTP-binding protein [Tritrichomonas foetus]|uniref:Small GTP-binding protein n=1 Tax=Tritrichomonas foetus TaxID=1144522 RepID=A0A1J4KWH7_9EUKA|nr:small GTP-binding protein [Tritrichomonas foetus]|eukprot:OHT15232.1 small GTP-binding protein [Tritrichomonas foetus]